jgi:hypothetical protein
MPPSLRRTFSSPSVRPSPYPLGLSNSNVGSGRVYGHRHRRSSGSDTSTRRVLADLEWWRVVDGQHDGDAEQETEDSEQDQGQGHDGGVPSGNTQSLIEDTGVERPSTPLTWTFESPHDVEVRVLQVVLHFPFVHGSHLLPGYSESTHQPVCCSLHRTTHAPPPGTASYAYPRVVFLFIGVHSRGHREAPGVHTLHYDGLRYGFC